MDIKPTPKNFLLLFLMILGSAVLTIAAIEMPSEEPKSVTESPETTPTTTPEEIKNVENIRLEFNISQEREFCRYKGFKRVWMIYMPSERKIFDRFIPESESLGFTSEAGAYIICYSTAHVNVVRKDAVISWLTSNNIVEPNTTIKLSNQTFKDYCSAELRGSLTNVSNDSITCESWDDYQLQFDGQEVVRWYFKQQVTT